MRVSTLAVASMAGFAMAAPYNPFPLSDGFPSPNATQLGTIESNAGGTLPNGGLPTSLSAAATVTLQLIALNEIFEVAFFSQLLNNITTSASGFDTSSYNSTQVKAAIMKIVNQEQMHALGANGILMNANQTAIKPCQYNFPVSNFISAISFANLFTDVVLSVLPGAQVTFAQDGGDEVGLVQLIGSIIAQEGQQDGWFRSLQGNTPSAAPFLTTTAPQFALSLLQTAIVNGSCPNVDLITKYIPSFPPLTVTSSPGAKDGNATFSVMSSGVSASNYSIAYLSGQNLPVNVPISNVMSMNGMTTFTASLPFASGGFAQGLTIAALVKGASGQKFMNASAVAAATVAGPGAFEIL